MSERVDAIARRVIDETKQRMLDPESHRPIKTGLDDLDKIIGGITRPAYIAIGGKWKTGKTMMAQHIALALSAAKRGRVEYYLLEEVREQMAIRNLASGTSKVTRNQFRDLCFDDDAWQDIEESYTLLEGLDFYVEDDIYHFNQIIATALERKATYIIIDYLQLVESDGINERERIERISKKIIHERNHNKLTFIVVYQLNERGTAHGSRAVYRDADLAIEIRSKKEDTGLEGKTGGIIEIHALPGRFSPGGTMEACYSGAHSLITNIPTLHLEDLTFTQEGLPLCQNT